MDPIPIRLPADLQASVDRLAEELSISRSAVLRLAIRHWVDAANRHGLNPLIHENEPATRIGKAAGPVPSYPDAKEEKRRKRGTTRSPRKSAKRRPAD